MSQYFLVIDVEATCWQGDEAKLYTGQNEIFEIGLARTSMNGLMLNFLAGFMIW
ncbi:hypothetical protein OAO01_01040 [Oligoflexia bacterium]|nr:hypothetical protein [Oligoflexia bacterium]